MRTNPEPRIQVRRTFKLDRGRRGQQTLEKRNLDEAPTIEPPTGRVPRISRLMALALRSEQLLQAGAVADYAELSRLSHVTRARITQIMNLLNLAPDIQEAILFLPLVEFGRDPIREHAIRPIAATLDWRKQRRAWRMLQASSPAKARSLNAALEATRR